MELTEISKFLEKPSRLKLVSKEWRDKINTRSKSILTNAYKKYPNARSIFEIVRLAIYNNDIQTIREIAYEYTGYLPIVWNHLTYMLLDHMNIQIIELLYDKMDKGRKHLGVILDLNRDYKEEKVYKSWMSIPDIFKIKRYDLILDMDTTLHDDLVSDIEENVTNIPYDVHQWIKKNIQIDRSTIYGSILFDDVTAFDKLGFDIGYDDTIRSYTLHLDAVNIWKKYKAGLGWYEYSYRSRGKILEYIIDNESTNNVLYILYTITKWDLDIDAGQMLDVVYIIYTRTKDSKVKEYIESLCIDLGWIEIIDIYDRPITTKNIMMYMSRAGVFSGYDRKPLYRYLQHKGIDIEPYRVYVFSYDSLGTLFRKKYKNFWRQFLVYVVRNNNHNVMERIIKQHKKQMNQESLDYLYDLIKENKYGKITDVKGTMDRIYDYYHE